MEEFLRTHSMAELRLERELKHSERGQILLLRHPDSHQRFIFRVHDGSADVYQKLHGLSCPHLPDILAVSERNGRVLILEEYIPGDSLAFLLEGGALTLTQARSIAIEVCRALTVLHKLGVVHRDVKPENILLRGTEAVLIDFDASRTYKEDTSGDTRIMGTPGYAAPEQYGFSQTDARADIYSMGILLNEMLTRKHPSTKLADGALRPVIEKCIAVNADMRYSSAAELAAALEFAAAPGGKTRRFALLAAGLLAAAALVFALRPSPAPETISAPSPMAVSAENSITPKTTEDVSLELLSDTAASWDGDRPPAYTAFQYDLDGDGEKEDYLFGVGIDLPNPKPYDSATGMLLENIIAPIPNHIAPCVWRQTGTDEYGNGVFALTEEFAELITDVNITLYCMEQWGTQAPKLWSAVKLFDVWPNAAVSYFTNDCAGVWMYKIDASIDGMALTSNLIATASTTTPDGGRISSAADPAKTADPIFTWEGDRPPAYDSFLYDLDGDGIDEEYIFGMVIDHKDSMPADGTIGLHLYDLTALASVHMAPCVWRQSEATGEYQRVDEFSSLLANGKITLWCIDRSGTAAPTLQSDNKLFSIWPNAIRSYFTTESAGVWMYEVSATLNGDALTGNLQITTVSPEYLITSTHPE